MSTKNMATQCPYCATVFQLDDAQLRNHGHQVRCGRCYAVFSAIRNMVDRQDNTKEPSLIDNELEPKVDPEVFSPPKGSSYPDATPHEILYNEPLPAPNDDLTKPSHLGENELENAAVFSPKAPPLSADDLFAPELPEKNQEDLATKPSPQEAPDCIAQSNERTPHQESPLDTISLVNLEDAITPPHKSDAVPLNYGQATTDSNATDRSERPATEFGEPLSPEKPQTLDILKARQHSILMKFALSALILLLLLQISYTFRHTIVKQVPSLAPYFGVSCDNKNCIPLERKIHKVYLSSSKLEQKPFEPSNYTLHLTVSNSSNRVLAWPNFTFILRDVYGTQKLRKNFIPANFLNPKIIKRGIPANGSKSVAIRFVIRGVEASNYTASLFY